MHPFERLLRESEHLALKLINIPYRTCGSMIRISMETNTLCYHNFLKAYLSSVEAIRMQQILID